ncbi:MAG: HD domain-containing protein [Candidatus Obscuribacterales bacterium]|nr:HD domain-containing protein [Candidatus Obscuribacterales bacterium]
MTEDLALLFDALSYASEMHSKQRRKNKEASPYINHPIDVGRILVTIGKVNDTNILAAAILHDTIEDTAASHESIQERFGEDIACLVMECTDYKSLPKAKRKQLQIDHAAQKSERAKLIKLADKISNVSNIGESPPQDWSHERISEYLDWTEKVVAGLKGTNRDLDLLYQKVLSEARAAVGRSH